MLIYPWYSSDVTAGSAVCHVAKHLETCQERLQQQFTKWNKGNLSVGGIWKARFLMSIILRSTCEGHVKDIEGLTSTSLSATLTGFPASFRTWVPATCKQKYTTFNFFRAQSKSRGRKCDGLCRVKVTTQAALPQKLSQCHKEWDGNGLEDKWTSEFWSDVCSEHNCFFFLVHQRSSQRLGQRSEHKTKVRSEGKSKVRVTVTNSDFSGLNF